MSASPWMDAAWSHVGLKETAGPKATPEIVELYAKAGHPEVQSDEVAWCAAFVGACLKDGGLPNTGSLLARSYLKYGTGIEAPKPGAIAVFRRGSDPASGHVAFVTGWGDGKIRVLGGNQHDSVCEANYDQSLVIGYRWPPATEVSGDKPVAAINAPAPNPLHRSGTIWGSVGAAIAGAGVYLEQMFSILVDTAAKWSEILPGRDMIASVLPANIAGNGKAMSLGLLAGCVVLIVSRRVKAGQEGKAG